MAEITQQQLDALAKLADKADNFYFAAQMKLPDRIHVQALSDGMKDICAALKKLYVEIAGDDPWA